MSRAAPEAMVRRLLLALLLAGGHAGIAQEINPPGETPREVPPGTEAPQEDNPPAVAPDEFDLTPGVDSFEERSVEKSLLEAISRIEASGGAYAADLPEQMLSLGLALQQQDRHGEAIEVFKRGVHLARINNGLYCPDQVPLLRGEIQSSIALGEYARVDELQQYLYRVQLRGLAGGEERADALMQQATWQFNAYQLGLGSQGPDRLVTMWDMYRQAWNDLSEVEQDTSPKLLPPLNGMLRTQYLISEYRAENEASGSSFGASPVNPDVNRFYAYRAENYELGRSVILAIYQIQSGARGPGSTEAIEALVALGDWAQWNSKRDDAIETYQLALAELAGRDDAQEEEQRLFGAPVPLPDMNGLRTLPPAVSADQGNILVEFGVDSRGKVVDLARLDSNEDIDSAANRLLRLLRNTTFRPRLAAGQPVGTDKLVRAYEIKP